MRKTFSKIALSAAVAVLFSACGGGPKIVIPSYTAPKEVSKLKKIETKDEFIAKGAYLAIWLDPNVKGAEKTNKKLKDMLIESVKSSITQTNFIALDPLGDDDSVALKMEVLNYSFAQKGKKSSLYLEVSFTLSRGVDEFLVKKYHYRVSRQSTTAIISEDELASKAVAKVVKYFISDISPLKTNQLREFKPLPDKLKYVVDYAKRKNYKGAIKMMEGYKGEKDKNYYYNLAILYEAQASESEDLNLLKKAQANYEKSIELGGGEDKVIMDAKARFDKFYELLNKTKKVQKNNDALLKDRNSMAGSSDDEYE